MQFEASVDDMLAGGLKALKFSAVLTALIFQLSHSFSFYLRSDERHDLLHEKHFICRISESFCDTRPICSLHVGQCIRQNDTSIALTASMNRRSEM